MELRMPERMIDISFPVQENIFLSLHKSKDEFAKEMLFSGAVVLYKKRKLSLGKAAELAGYLKLDFIEKMQTENLDIFDYNEDEIYEVVEDAKL